MHWRFCCIKAVFFYPQRNDRIRRMVSAWPMAPDDFCCECAATSFNIHHITHYGNRTVEEVLISAEFAFGHDFP
ncbi:hypothetical protein B0W47_11045 [Komagataeibacter nataicola]|uniref:Uncharacterized protein n=1 Tax=Komagataeibacter nataicola TaxID=265960 RepID=A0A9N7H387_9PROT|nr:hypothetical protein B0W47_11045 [Komagataeibacter nataicola]PYD66069.1 hypothetical protein CDI09_10175 [Komagataeibacter nataicola]